MIGTIIILHTPSDLHQKKNPVNTTQFSLILCTTLPSSACHYSSESGTMDNPKKSAQETNSADALNIDNSTHAPDTFRSATGTANLNKASHVQFPEVPAPAIPRQNSDMTSPGPGYAPSIGTDDGEDSEEYDWSAEEDLVDEAAKFESKIGVSRRDGWSLKRFCVAFPSFTSHKFWPSL